MSEKYTVSRDPYCYPNSTVFRNKADIREQAALDALESHLTRARVEQFTPDYTEFSLASLQSIHFFLFQDLYDWAGQLRIVDISKGSTRFANINQLEREANLLFARLKKENFLQEIALDQFIARIADYYCELNVIHPFRDGNGRAQRLFFELLAINAGYTFNWACIQPNEWQQANIAAYHCRLHDLEQLIRRSVQPIE